jgi:hypothetical protein
MRRRTFIAGIGTAAAWPLAARAQQSERMRRIGVLAAHERHVPEFEGLRDQLRELGYVEGRNFLIDWRSPRKGLPSCPSRPRNSSIYIPMSSLRSPRRRRPR